MPIGHGGPLSLGPQVLSSWPGALAVVALAVGLGYGWLRPVVLPANNFQLQPPQAVADFHLQQANGKPFRPSQLLGRWSAVFSGFTNCPDVCPVTLSLLAEVSRFVDVQLIFVSVDPERDSPDVLREYLSYFSSDAIGVTGSNQQLDRLLTSLGFYPSVRTSAAVGGASVPHSGTVAVINPEGKLAGLIRGPLSLEVLKSRLGYFVAQPGINSG